MPTIDLASSFYYILYYYKSRYNIDLIAPRLDARSLYYYKSRYNILYYYKSRYNIDLIAPCARLLVAFKAQATSESF
jgi:hypothetical protein